MAVVYLLFNEGYAASTGNDQLRVDLCDEAIRLGRVLHDLLPGESEVDGLLALMLLHHSRRLARQGLDGRLVVLEDQDRSRWDRAAIDEGSALLVSALERRRVGPYQLQAAISAVHADAHDWAATDWAQILGLYDALLALQDSPVIRLNRLVALGMVRGPNAALTQLDGLATQLDRYGPYHAVRADLLWRSGQIEEARREFRLAAQLAGTTAERDHLRARASRSDLARGFS